MTKVLDSKKGLAPSRFIVLFTFHIVENNPHHQGFKLLLRQQFLRALRDFLPKMSTKVYWVNIDHGSYILAVQRGEIDILREIMISKNLITYWQTDKQMLFVLVQKLLGT